MKSLPRNWKYKNWKRSPRDGGAAQAINEVPAAEQSVKNGQYGLHFNITAIVHLLCHADAPLNITDANTAPLDHHDNPCKQAASMGNQVENQARERE